MQNRIRVIGFPGECCAAFVGGQKQQVDFPPTGLGANLLCDDEDNVIPRLYRILKGCIGWEISRIGDLDVDL
jgi:hypothetical protein